MLIKNLLHIFLGFIWMLILKYRPSKLSINFKIIRKIILQGGHRDVVLAHDLSAEFIVVGELGMEDISVADGILNTGQDLLHKFQFRGFICRHINEELTEKERV